MTCRVENQTLPESSPTRSTVFNNVTLYLPQNQTLVKQTISLEFLLQTLVNVEQVDQVATKQQSFARLPKCLCLHIQVRNLILYIFCLQYFEFPALFLC